MIHRKYTAPPGSDPVAYLWHFVGRTDAYATQRSDGTYRGNIEQPLTDDLITRHLRGAVTLGAYQVDASGLARAFVVDVDSDGTPEGIGQAKGLALAMVAASPGPLIVEFSGSKGWHAWGLLAGPVPQPVALNAARTIAEAVGFTGAGRKSRHTASGLTADLYPQPLGAGGLGALVKLPLGKHAKSGAWSFFVGSDGERVDGLPEIELISPADLPVSTGQPLPTVSLSDWRDEPRLPVPDWLFAVGDSGLPQSFRNRGLYLIASRLVRSQVLAAWEIEALTQRFAAASRPPVEPREVQAILKSAFTNPTRSLGLEEFADAGLIALAEVAA